MEICTYRRAVVVVAFAAGLVPAVASDASLVTATDYQTNGTTSLPQPYTPSNTDLLNGMAPTTLAGTFTQEGTGGTPVLTDGAFPSPITRDAGGAFPFGAFATGGSGGGTSLTYTLPNSVNLTSIVVYGGWQDGGRDEQLYTVSYATAQDPGTFIAIGSVDFNPPAPGQFPQVTRVTLTDDTGTLAANAKLLKFDFGSPENGYTGYAEIDAFGSAPLPEPTSAAALGLGALGLLARRRRGC